MGWIKDIGVAMASAKGWAYAVSLVPTALVFGAGLFEGRPWSEIIVLVTIALVAGLLLVGLALTLWERTTSYFATRKDQRRIAQDIVDYMDEGFTEIDTSTAAALWAGTNDPTVLQFKLKFRRIKMAINKQEITGATKLSSKGKAFIKTNVPTESLKQYFLSRNIISEKDL